MEVPNLNYIKELSEGDDSFKESMIKILKDEFPKERIIFLENINNKKYKAAADNVHKIKHKISVLGLKEDLIIASKFELDLLFGKLKLLEIFIKCLDKINVYLGKL